MMETSARLLELLRSTTGAYGCHVVRRRNDSFGRASLAHPGELPFVATRSHELVLPAESRDDIAATLRPPGPPGDGHWKLRVDK